MRKESDGSVGMWVESRLLGGDGLVWSGSLGFGIEVHSRHGGGRDRCACAVAF